MLIRKIKNLKELEECVDMYLKLSDQEFLPASRKASIKSLKEVLSTPKAFVRVLEKEGKLVAWIYAEVIQLQHTTFKVLQQIYYSSCLEGVSAARAVKLLHQALIEEAERRRVIMVTSPGSHLDENFTFAKILEKSGWERRGYMSVYKTKFYPKDIICLVN
jgi:hypothetical protein